MLGWFQLSSSQRVNSLADLLFGSGTRPERPLVLDEHAATVGEIVPSIVHLTEMNTEDVEMVPLRDVDQKTLRPLHVPREPATRRIGEKPMERDVAAAQQNLLPVQQEFPSLDFELTHAERSGEAILRNAGRFDLCLQRVQEWIIRGPEMRIRDIDAQREHGFGPSREGRFSDGRRRRDFPHIHL